MTPAERLEKTQFDVFWIPEDTRVFDREGVLALCCERPLPHLNQGLRAAATAKRLPSLVHEVCASFAPRCGRWLVPDTAERGPLLAALEDERFEPGHAYEARVTRTDRHRASPAPALRIQPVENLAHLRDMMSVGRRAFDVPLSFTDAELLAQLETARACGARVRRFVGYDGAEPVCSGGMNLYPGLSMALLWAGGTVPEARGRGFYGALVAARIALARTLGLTWVGLYAQVDTSAPIIAKQGFEHVGEMVIYEAEGAVRPT